MQDNTTDKELVLQAMREYGRSKAAQLQEASAEMTGTELYAAEDYIPDFAAACAQKNMLERAAGFVCRSAAGRVVRLLQPYDSTIYTDEPEALPAQWGFVWSTDPDKALLFVAMAAAVLDDWLRYWLFQEPRPHYTLWHWGGGGVTNGL